MSNHIEVFTPDQVAAFIQSTDPKFHAPSEEQKKIISVTTNPLEPAVVIAGAGSGKTETMAARVVYLVANGIVRPDQVLGLTFTRKAAGELNARIRKRLKQLEAGMKAANVVPPFSTFDATVTTYHSYAAKLLSEHSIRLGIDADSRPLGEANLWMMARSIVQNWSDDSFTSEDGLDTVVTQVTKLASAMLEHGVTADEIINEDQKIIDLIAALDGRTNKDTLKVAAVARQRQAILPMVAQFLEKRREGGELSFDDQIAFAGQIAERFSDVVELEKSKFPVVLLDEYQDTSHSQIRLLSTLFGSGHPVTAVGDPYQSIYTWRGAASGTIGAFNRDFPKVEGQSGASQFNLSRTYRNDISILTLANHVSAQISPSMTIEVPPLDTREDAGPGELVCGIYETREHEATAIAEYFKQLWGSVDQYGKPRTFAVLVRARRLIPAIQSAMESAGLPYEVIGLSGLMHVPEIADIISILRVIESPDAGSALIRHLTGPRINLGARDIVALGRYSKSLSQSQQTDSRSIVENIVNGNYQALEADDIESGSLIEALDLIESANAADFSTAGFARLLRFSSDLRRIRARAAAPLVDLILEIERYLNLEVEVSLRESKGGGRRHLDKFIDEAATFARSGGTLSGFIHWLDAASKSERGLKMSAPEPNPDVVQILTVHTAKGAEWSVVAIPGLNVDLFPSDTSRDLENWLSNEGVLPFALYRNSMPEHGLDKISTFAQATKTLEDFKNRCKLERLREEHRLGYVAVTRAKSHLFCTAAYWGDGVEVLKKSELYNWVETIARDHGKVIDACEEPDAAKQDISQLDSSQAIWPRDPIADRRVEFDSQIAMVRAANGFNFDNSETVGASENSQLQSWIEDARAIIAEAREFESGTIEIPRPSRMSPSAIIAMKKNPDEFAKSIRRPMPRARDQYSERGTAFHLWVEKHLTNNLIITDEDLDLMSPFESDTTLEELKAKWLASEFGGREVHKVEVPFETMIAGVLVRGRIDAIYKTEQGFEVVDWKTGATVLDDDSAIQLAIYRLAWAKLEGISVDKVSAAFHYVPTSQTDRRTNLMSEAELIALLS